MRDASDTRAVTAAGNHGFLSATQRRTLERICDALVPSLAAEDGDDPRLFAYGAREARLVEAIEPVMARAVTGAKRRQLRLFLTALECGAVGTLTAGRLGAFSKLDLEARTAVLRALATSPLAAARAAFQGFKRLALFAFYGGSANGGNSTWEALGYPGPPGARVAAPRPIVPLVPSGTARLDCDVLVVGSGAGGGVVAGELTAAGLDVIVAEKGGYLAAIDFDGAEVAATESMLDGRGALANADGSLVVMAGSTLGGGTTVNWMTCLPPPPSVLEEWERDHGFEGACGCELQESLDAVAGRIHVQRGESPLNGPNAVLERGCRELGWRVAACPRNARGCVDCSFCCFGCAYGAKQSTLDTYLRDAHSGGARILVEARVGRVTHSAGRATGAEIRVRGAGGSPVDVTVRARAVVAAAGAVHTPALLARSGLTNRNIGAHLRLHPGTASFGLHPGPTRPWLGAPQTRLCDQFADLDGHGHGFTLEVASSHPGLAAMASPWTSGRRHKRLMQRFDHLSNVMVFVRDRYGGKVSVDRAGQPVIDYRLHRYDARHLMRGLLASMRVHRAAGAHTVLAPHSANLEHRGGDAADFEAYLRDVRSRGFEPNAFALFSAHQMSSCRIGGDRKTSAVRPDGETWEMENLFVADGSVFPTAVGVNPMLPIMGVAHYLARHVRNRLT